MHNFCTKVFLRYHIILVSRKDLPLFASVWSALFNILKFAGKLPDFDRFLKNCHFVESLIQFFMNHFHENVYELSKILKLNIPNDVSHIIFPSLSRLILGSFGTRRFHSGSVYPCEKNHKTLLSKVKSLNGQNFFNKKWNFLLRERSPEVIKSLFFFFFLFLDFSKPC